MTSVRITPIRFFFAAGATLLTTLSVGAPAFATNEFPPNAVLTATSGCEGDVFHLHATLSNPGGLDTAHFVLNSAGGKYLYEGFGVNIDANISETYDWEFFESVPGTVHITSSDGNPAIDFNFAITPDCVPEVTTTVVTTIPESTIPATTIPATTIPAPTTTAVGQFAPTALPATGSSSPSTGVLAFGLLGVGILLLRFTRRVS